MKKYKKISTYKKMPCEDIETFLKRYDDWISYLREIGDEYSLQSWENTYMQLNDFIENNDDLLESEYGDDIPKNRFIGAYKEWENVIIDRRNGKEIYKISR